MARAMKRTFRNRGGRLWSFWRRVANRGVRIKGITILRGNRVMHDNLRMTDNG
jgi:hypothetical protein